MFAPLSVPRGWSLCAAAALACAGLGGCVAPVGPVSVARFVGPTPAALGHGSVAVVAGAGGDPASLEWQTYQGEVQRQLRLLGYADGAAADAGQIAELSLLRSARDPAPAASPVHVGLGGQTGGYGSGVGLGLGIALGPKPARQVTTELAVRIRERASGTVLWEGRADFTVAATSPLADTALAAPKLAAALFGGFPGASGQTIEVR